MKSNSRQLFSPQSRNIAVGAIFVIIALCWYNFTARTEGVVRVFAACGMSGTTGSNSYYAPCYNPSHESSFADTCDSFHYTRSEFECKCDIDVPPCSHLARTGYTKGCCLVDTRRDEFEDTRRDEFEDCELPYAVELFALMYW